MAKAFGFKLIPATNLEAVYNDMCAEGTCCMAYGDFIDKHVNMLLEGCAGLQAIRAKDADNEELLAWCNLDDEIVEALIMLRAMVNVQTETLYWCSMCKNISKQPFDCTCNEPCVDYTCCAFGLDFSK